MQPGVTPTKATASLTRIRIWQSVLLLLVAIVVIRLFYLQVIRHDYYKNEASARQLREYKILPERGAIEAHDGQQIVPIVLNEKRYTLYVDPVYIRDAHKSATALQQIIGGNSGEYEQKMRTHDTRYVVLAKKLNKEQKDKVEAARKREAKELEATPATYAWKGILTSEVPSRTYPQGQLAGQLLGFVNDEGEGKYGIEQALNEDLKGLAGQLRAVTDAQGVPLAANKDNVIKAAQSGKRVVLTIDVSMQKQLEDILKAGLERAKSGSGSALIIDPSSGAIKAIANYPTYNPAEFFKVEDGARFQNSAVTAPLEIGSTMKPLTAAAALNTGAVNRNATYYDPSRYKIDGYTISNIEEDGGPGTRSVADILQLSLNTGATWLLMQMGGGEVNKQARNTWHDYMTNHYRFGRMTGIEQGQEAAGIVPDPNEGYGLNLQFANTSFGQGMTATPLQLGAAFASVLNGGTYYKPHLVEGLRDATGTLITRKPEVIRGDVVKPEVSKTIQEFMEYTFVKNHVTYGMPTLRTSYSIGGKTGTAQVAKPQGGYYDDRFNGTFVGFVGGDTPQYIVVVSVNEPKITGYAGSKAAAPIFVNLAGMLIDNFGVAPKS